MDSFMTVDVPLIDLVCDKCRIDSQTKRVRGDVNYEVAMVDIPGSKDEEPIQVTLDVKRLKWCQEKEGRYTAYALLSIPCPCCDRKRELRHRLKAPFLFLTDTFVCGTCGGKLEFENRKLEYIHADEREPSIEIRGSLVCHECATDRLMEIEISSPELPSLIQTNSLRMKVSEGGVQINKRDFEFSRKTRPLSNKKS